MLREVLRRDGDQDYHGACVARVRFSVRGGHGREAEEYIVRVAELGGSGGEGLVSAEG